MQQMVFATGNLGKVREVAMMFDSDTIEILTLKQAGIQVDVVEDGTTFMENAVKKAKTIAEHTNSIVLADDSGLVVDALGGEPGIYSARYLGEDTSYDIKNQDILRRMEGVPKEKRTARFVCAMVAVMPGGEVIKVEETMEGFVAYASAGEHGFGYDPIFWLEEYGMTSAEILPEEKNRISHRGKALVKMQAELAKRVQ